MIARALLILIVSTTTLLAYGCLLDIAPSREPLDQLWNEQMLAGHYGEWVDGRLASSSTGRKDRIEPWVFQAAFTRYGIIVRQESYFGAADWGLEGGLIGRVEVEKAIIELFGKEIARIHAPFYTVRHGRDFSFEFFLVVRPKGADRGRIVRQWYFPSEAVALTPHPRELERLRQTYHSDEELQRAFDQYSQDLKSEWVAGYLRFDHETRVATVTIAGLKPRYEHSEQVDLSNELPR